MFGQPQKRLTAAEKRELVKVWTARMNECYERIEAMREACAMGDGWYDEQDFEEVRSEAEQCERMARKYRW